MLDPDGRLALTRDVDCLSTDVGANEITSCARRRNGRGSNGHERIEHQLTRRATLLNEYAPHSRRIPRRSGTLLHAARGPLLFKRLSGLQQRRHISRRWFHTLSRTNGSPLRRAT
jgi:hypothetical protein